MDTITADPTNIDANARNMSVNLIFNILSSSQDNVTVITNETLRKCANIVTNILESAIVNEKKVVTTSTGQGTNKKTETKRIETSKKEQAQLINKLTDIVNTISIVTTKNIEVGAAVTIATPKLLIYTKRADAKLLSEETFNVGDTTFNAPDDIAKQFSTLSSIDVSTVEWKLNLYEPLSNKQVLSNVFSLSLRTGKDKLKIENLKNPVVFQMKAAPVVKMKKTPASINIGGTDEGESRRLAYNYAYDENDLGSSCNNSQNENISFSSSYNINEEDILFCATGSVAFFSLIIVMGIIILMYVSYQSKKIFRNDHVRSAAYARAGLVTLCAVTYGVFLMAACGNKQLRPRFLQGFSILIFGLMLSGFLLLIPFVSGIFLMFAPKFRRKDLLKHIDWTIGVCIFLIFPTFIFSLVLWCNGRVLKDILENDGSSVVQYNGTCPSSYNYVKDSNGSIAMEITEEHICQFWDKKELKWSSEGCQTIIHQYMENSNNNNNNNTRESNFTTIKCECDHLTDFAVTLKRTANRLKKVVENPLDALSVHWMVPFTLSIIFSICIVAEIICAFWDLYKGRRYKMEARGYIAVLAYVRFRRKLMLKKGVRGSFVSNLDAKEAVRGSQLVKNYQNHSKDLYYTDILWDYFKKKHEILAFFFNAHLYFGRKEILAIFIMRMLIKICVLAVLFDMQKTYATRAILFDGRTDLIGFKIITLLCSMLTNKITGYFIKGLFSKYVKAKHNYRVVFYHKTSSWSLHKKRKYSENKGQLYNNAKKEATNASKKAWLQLQLWRCFIWFFSIFTIILSLLWIWAFSFAVKKEDDTMLDDWVGTGAISISLWLFFTRPIQIFIQSNIKYVKEKKKRRKQERKRQEEEMVGKNDSGGDGETMTDSINIEIEMPTLKHKTKDDTLIVQI